MEIKQCGLAIRIVTAVTFFAMVAVNALANTLPINGVTTGQVSDSYPNLFAPAGYTFAIWGLIYLLLAAYTLYQLGLFRSAKGPGKVVNADVAVSNGLLRQIGIFFSASSLANIAWIFSWHYNIIPLSMLLMAIILLCLIYITQLINRQTINRQQINRQQINRQTINRQTINRQQINKQQINRQAINRQQINRQQLSPREKLFVRLPFSVYFGWITVATIANATTLLVSLGWDGFGISEPIWTIIIVTVGMLIGVVTTIQNRDIAYGLVLVWAYVGILVKHLSPDGFAGQYTGVVVQVIVSIVLLLAAILYVFFTKKKVAVNQHV